MEEHFLSTLFFKKALKNLRKVYIAAILHVLVCYLPTEVRKLGIQNILKKQEIF